MPALYRVAALPPVASVFACPSAPREERYRSYRSLRRHLHCLGDLPEEFVASLWAAPDAVVDGGIPLIPENAARTTVEVRYGGRRFVVKRHRPRSCRHAAKDALLPSKAKTCWLATLRLREANVRTPQPVAYVEQRLGPLCGRSYYAYEYVEGETLRDYFGSKALSAAAIDGIARQMVRLWRTFGRLRVSHPDMHFGNFIVDGRKRLWVIDLDKIRWHRSEWDFRASWSKNVRLFQCRVTRHPEARFLRTPSGELISAFLERLLLGESCQRA